MKAHIIGIQSGVNYKDRERRIIISVDDAEMFNKQFTVRESILGVFAASIDDEIEIEFHPLTAHARRERDSALTSLPTPKRAI